MGAVQWKGWNSASATSVGRLKSSQRVQYGLGELHLLSYIPTHDTLRLRNIIPEATP